MTTLTFAAIAAVSVSVSLALTIIIARRDAAEARRGGDLRPRRRLAVDDTFGGDDGLSDELPAGTIVVDDCGNEADAWICRGRGKWMHTGGVTPIRLPRFYTYKIIHMPEVES